MINNTPEIKLGIVAVSRDCFPNLSLIHISEPTRPY